MFVQGNAGGALRLRLRSGNPVHGHQGPAAIPDHHYGCQTEEQGIVGDLQRFGSAGRAAVPCPQPARALRVSADPDAHGSVHLEEASLRRSPDHHHALLVWSGLLLLPGKEPIRCSDSTVVPCSMPDPQRRAVCVVKGCWFKF